MSIGTPVAKSEVDLWSGQLSRDIDLWCMRVLRFKSWLDGMTDQALQDAPYGYSSGEVALLKSAVADLAQLATIRNGGAVLAQAKDFGAFSKQLTGIGMF